MSTALTAAFYAHALGLLIMAAFALVYLTRRTFMPYHQVAVGSDWNALPRGIQVLLLGLMRVVGFATLAVVIGNFVMLVGPFRAGEMWARWTIAATGLLLSFGGLSAMHSVGAQTPARPPYRPAMAGAAMTAIGFVLSMLG